MALTRPAKIVKAQNIDETLLNVYLRDNVNGLHWLAAYQSADLTKNNDAALANLAGLSFPVVSGDVWLFGAHSFFLTSSAANAKWAVTAPGSSTGRYGVLGHALSGDASTPTFGTALVRGVSASVEDNTLLFGLITAGADGTVQLQAAQNTATVFDTIFRQYSPLIAWRLSTPGNLPIPSFSANQVLTAANLQTWVSDALNDLRFQHGHLREQVVANGTTTLQTLTDMSFSVRTGETWAWFSFIYFKSAVTPDVAFAATAPPGSAGRYGVAGSDAPITAGSTSTFGGRVEMFVPSTLTLCVSLNGLVTAGADGNVQLQGTQNTSTPGTDTTFFQDSWFVAFRL